MRDAISRDNLMNYCRNQVSRAVDCNDIARMPSLDVMPIVRAEWIRHRTAYEDRFRCSNCNTVFRVDTCLGKPLWNGCPLCLAVMNPEFTPKVGEYDGSNYPEPRCTP